MVLLLQLNLFFHHFKSPASTEIPDHVATRDFAKNVHEFIHDPKSGRFFESWYNKHKYVFTMNLAKWDEETRVRCLVRKLGSVENEFYSKFVLPKEFDEINYSETEIFGQKFSLYFRPALIAPNSFSSMVRAYTTL